MDFFQRQDSARRKTKWLVLYFAAATLATILAVYVVFALVYTTHNQTKRYRHRADVTFWNPELFGWVTAGTLLVVIGGSLYKIAELSAGGALVASSLGGRPLDINTPSVEEKKLRNVVEEMAIASGVPVPQIYVLPEEDGINAFAAGFNQNDAVIGVTRGAIQALTRDELQGVIGHEFSHILNGDMRLNMRLIGVINGLLCIALLGKVLLRAMSGRTRGRNDGRAAVFVIGLGLVVIGSIGMFFGRLIKSAISRQREFLADASAVQFTRNPQGLAGALKKIGGCASGSKLEAPNAEEASHLFFGNALSDGWMNLMATHPPLEERIRALDPAWDGKYPVVRIEREVVVTPVATASPRIAPRFIPPPTLDKLIGASTTFGANQVLVNTGVPTPQQVCYAAELRAAIPDHIRSIARESLGASTIIYSLLLDVEEPARLKQLRELQESNTSAVYEETLRTYSTVASIDARLRLPLVNLCLPALRLMSKDQYFRFNENIRQLIESDRRIFLFEYMLQKIVLRNLEPNFNPGRKPVIQYYVLKPLEEDIIVLLSALARHGSEEPAAIQHAFSCGVQQLKFSISNIALLGDDQCDLPQIDAALNRIASAAPMVKKTVLNACASAVAADGVVHMKEAELLRAIAETLDCPIPPFVQNI